MELSSSRLEHLIHAPDRQKVEEALGRQPTIWGACCIILACLFALPIGRPREVCELEIAAGLAALGLALLAYESRRRRNRTILVRDGDQIVIFRKGRPDMVVAPEEITKEGADIYFIMTFGASLALLAVLFTAIGVTGIVKDKKASADDLIFLSLGLAFCASFANAAWTRFALIHLKVPVKKPGWRAWETVLLPPSRLKALFPGGRITS